MNTMTTRASSDNNYRGDTTRRKMALAAMVAAGSVGLGSMAWACTPQMGTAQISPSSVKRDTTFKFWGQGLRSKVNYKLYFVDNVQKVAGLDCHSTNTVFTTKYWKYNTSGTKVAKPGMRTTGTGELDSDFTVTGIQPYKAFLPSIYPEDNVAGPHDFRPGMYPEPGTRVPTGASVVCARQVDAAGNLTDETATQHLAFTVA